MTSANLKDVGEARPFLSRVIELRKVQHSARSKREIAVRLNCAKRLQLEDAAQLIHDLFGNVGWSLCLTTEDRWRCELLGYEAEAASPKDAVIAAILCAHNSEAGQHAHAERN